MRVPVVDIIGRRRGYLLWDRRGFVEAPHRLGDDFVECGVKNGLEIVRLLQGIARFLGLGQFKVEVFQCFAYLLSTGSDFSAMVDQVLRRMQFGKESFTFLFRAARSALLTKCKMTA